MMQKRSQETRANILNAAQSLFAQNGYDATGVADICQEAGVSKGSFYYHFPSKQALFLELLDEWLSGLDVQLNLLRQNDQSAPDSLIAMTSVLPLVFQSAGNHLQMFLEFWIQASRDATIWEATIAPYHRYQTLFASLIEEGITEGSLEPVDTQITAQVIVSFAVGLLLQGLLDPQGADWEKVAKQGIQYLMDGITKSPK
jgi:AcrR family transcriptional regulator